MDIIVASYNRHKVEELSPMFPAHRLLSPQDLGLDLHGISCDPFLKKVL